MGYKSCHHCNLVFEVDPGTYDPRCLQCSQPLVEYVPPTHGSSLGSTQGWGDPEEDDEPTAHFKDGGAGLWDVDSPSTAGQESMGSTRLVGVLDLPLPGEEPDDGGDQRTRMLSPISAEPAAPAPMPMPAPVPQGGGEARTQMLSSIDDALLPAPGLPPAPAPAAPMDDQRTNMFTPIRGGSLHDFPAVQPEANSVGGDESTRMLSPIDLDVAPQPAPRPAPRPVPQAAPRAAAPIQRAPTAPPMPPRQAPREAPAPPPAPEARRPIPPKRKRKRPTPPPLAGP